MSLTQELNALQDVCAEVSKRFVERDEMVRAVVAAVVADIPLVVFGPPGTSKSAIVREVAQFIEPAGGQKSCYFEYILTSHTMPEELFGVPDLEKLKDGCFHRNTEGMLPKAHFAFLDEVFRGSSQILNTLLSIINERRFHDGADIHTVPLVGIVAAANTPPSDPDMDAFYDRFPIRVWVDSIFPDGRMDKKQLQVAAGLLESSLNLALTPSGGSNPGKKSSKTRRKQSSRKAGDAVKLTVPLERLRAQISEEMKAIPAQEEFKAFAALFGRFRESFRLSDRTFYRLCRFAVAWKWVNPEKNVSLTDAMRFVAPTKEKHREIKDRLKQIRCGSHHASAH